MTTPAAADLAAALGLRRDGRGKWRGPCPIHGGSSFTLAERDGKPVWTCWSGCDRGAILEELRQRGLWPAAERRELTPEEKRRWAEAKRQAEAIARLAGAWHTERLAELEAQKLAAVDLEGGPWNTDALAAAAKEHHHLSTADAEGVLRAWRAARELEPVGTRELERIGLEWRAACERMAGMFAGFLEGVRSDAA